MAYSLILWGGRKPLRVPEIMTTTIPEILACLKEGQNAEIVAEREEANSFRASYTASGGREQLC